MLVLLGILLLTGPLTASQAVGAQARLAEAEPAAPPSPLRPEQIRFGHLTTEDGLSENRVWGITQDRRGFLWFTSYDGINRYDEQVYKYDPRRGLEPSSRSLSAIRWWWLATTCGVPRDSLFGRGTLDADHKKGAFLQGLPPTFRQSQHGTLG